MPKLTGIFDDFPDLENISVENIAEALNRQGNLKQLEDELGNKIFYSQVVPTTVEEVSLEQAVLQEALKIHANLFYVSHFNVLYIPDKFYYRYKDTLRLVFLFIDAIKPHNLTSIMLKVALDGTKSLGAYIRPHVENAGAMTLTVGEKTYHLNTGRLLQIPVISNHADIKLESDVATVFGQHSFMAEIKGGQLGILIDTRATL